MATFISNFDGKDVETMQSEGSTIPEGNNDNKEEKA